ncbi:hypothetical protein D9M71_396810 [compost metagenome]
MHCGFRGAVSTGKWRDQHTRNAADIHHYPFGPAQHREECARHTDNRKHIGFELPLHGRHTAVQQRPHGAITGVVDQHIEAAMLLVDAFAQLFECLAIVDVQLHGDKTGRGQRCDIFSLAGAGPDFVASSLERIGKGAANAAGTSGNQRNGHGAVLVQKSGGEVSRRKCRANARRETPGFPGDSRGATAAWAGNLPSYPQPAIRQARDSEGRCTDCRPG